MKSLPRIGDRLIVAGIRHAVAKVANIVHDHETDRTLITVDWGQFGYSRVWLHDEGESWFRYETAN